MATLKELVNETTNIKNELVNCYDNLKNNLIDKKVEVSNNDKMNDLINKVSTMKGFPSGWDIEASGEVILNDVEEGDAVVLQKYGNFDSVIEPLINPFDVYPDASSYNETFCKYSPDGKYFTIGKSARPLYKVEGDTYINIPLGSSALASKSGIDYIGFSNNNDFLYLYSSAGSSPYHYFFKKTETGYTLNNTPGTNYLPKSLASHFTEDGNYCLVIGPSDSTAFSYLKKNASGIWQNPSSNPSSSVTSYAYNSGVYSKLCDAMMGLYYYSSSNTYLVCARFDFATETFKPLSNINVFDIEDTKTKKYMSISNDHRFIAMYYGPSAATNRVTVYKWSEEAGKYLKLPNLPILPTNYITDVSFSEHGDYMTVISSASTNNIKLYKFDGSSYTEVSSLIADSGVKYTNATFRPGGEHLYMNVNDSEGDVNRVYRTEVKNVVCNYDVPNLPYFKLSNKQIGVALESKSKGEQIKVNLFPKLEIK